MCIRDRVTGGWCAIQCKFYAPDHHLAKKDIDSFIAASNTCLLYTSDAADERSSVDLGGRRIIKKKKIDGDSERPTTIYT